jgi:hypothetical protein
MVKNDAKQVIKWAIQTLPVYMLTISVILDLHRGRRSPAAMINWSVKFCFRNYEHILKELRMGKQV